MTAPDIGDVVVVLPWFARKGSKMHKRKGVVTGIDEQSRDTYYEVDWGDAALNKTESPIQGDAVKRCRK